MVCIAGDLVQLAALAFFDGYTGASCRISQFSQSRLMGARCNQDFTDGSSSRAQRFKHRRKTIYLVHCLCFRTNYTPEGTYRKIRSLGRRNLQPSKAPESAACANVNPNKAP